jgi:hypothetical protein
MFAQRQIQSRRRSRSLRFEPLESRLALTGLALPESGSLDAYLAQPPVMGPVVELVAAVEDPAANLEVAGDAAIEAVVAQLAEQLVITTLPPTVGELEAEGEDALPPPTDPLPPPPTDPLPPPPTDPLPSPPTDPLPPPPTDPLPQLATLVSFAAERVDGGWVRLSGTVSSTAPEGTQVLFGGLVSASATCDAAGAFSIFVSDPGTSGFITAQVANSTTFLSVYLA